MSAGIGSSSTTAPVRLGAGGAEGRDAGLELVGGLRVDVRRPRLPAQDVVEGLAQLAEPEVVDDGHEQVALGVGRHEDPVVDVLPGVQVRDVLDVGGGQRVLGEHDDGPDGVGGRLRHGRI